MFVTKVQNLTRNKNPTEYMIIENNHFDIYIKAEFIILDLDGNIRQNHLIISNLFPLDSTHSVEVLHHPHP